MYKHPIAFLSVNNLTVARYAAAMMADYVGFCFDSSSDKYITVVKAKEIMGWLSGVKFIGEFYTKPADEITAIALELNLDKVMLYGEYSNLDMDTIPFEIISTNLSDNAELHFSEEKIIDKDGKIFALPFYSPNEDETGMIDFGEITDQLNLLEN